MMKILTIKLKKIKNTYLPKKNSQKTKRIAQIISILIILQLVFQEMKKRKIIIIEIIIIIQIVIIIITIILIL